MYKAKLALADAENTWRKDTEDALVQTFRASPGRLTSVLLLMAAGRIPWQMTEKQIKKVRDRLKVTAKPTWQSLLQVEKQVMGSKHFELSSVIDLRNREPLVQLMAELYKVELRPFPKLEEFLPVQA